VKINGAFPSDYLKAADLNGKAVRAIIESVSVEKMGDDTKPVLHFQSGRKMVLNKTNAMRLVEAIGSDETDDWGGWSITLYPAKVDFQGKRVDALRIDDRPGATKPPTAGVKRPTAPPEPSDDDLGGMPDDDSIPFSRMESY
jgi:hypothetical protein